VIRQAHRPRASVGRPGLRAATTSTWSQVGAGVPPPSDTGIDPAGAGVAIHHRLMGRVFRAPFPDLYLAYYVELHPRARAWRPLLFGIEGPGTGLRLRLRDPVGPAPADGPIRPSGRAAEKDEHQTKTSGCLPVHILFGLCLRTWGSRRSRDNVTSGIDPKWGLSFTKRGYDPSPIRGRRRALRLLGT